jgi:hypothetical protein
MNCLIYTKKEPNCLTLSPSDDLKCFWFIYFNECMYIHVPVYLTFDLIDKINILCLRSLASFCCGHTLYMHNCMIIFDTLKQVS